MQAAKQIAPAKRSSAAAHAVSRKTMPGLAVAAAKKPDIQLKRIQTRLSVNKPGDSFEQQADATADRVMRTIKTETGTETVGGTGSSQNSNSISRCCAGKAPVVPIFTPTAKTREAIHRKCAHCEEQEKKLQRKETGENVLASAGNEKMKFVETELAASKSGGQPLPAHINTFMSRSIGADFSAVRIHTGGNAVAMNKALHAHAFTNGKDIYFNAGMYDPESDTGKHLLAHELTHVVQQGYAKPMEAKATQPTTDKPAIQRFSLDDLAEFDPLSIDIETLARKYVPQVVEIKQAGGFAPWIENKVTGAIETAFSAVMGPVKSAADFISSLSPTLAKIINWLKTAGIKVSKNDCSSFTELATMIEQLADELASPVIEKIKEFAGKASAWCKDIWERFGMPVWDFIKRYVGSQWDMIKSLASTIWDKTAPIREWAASVWTKFKNWLGIGDGPEGQNGILQWIEKKITDVWNKVKEKIEPFKKQLMVVAGVLVMLSPAGPFIAAGAVFAVVFTAINWIRKNIHSPADIVKLRVKFEKEILPSMMAGLQKAAAGLKALFASLSGKIDAVVGAFGNLANLVVGSILSFIQSALQWVADKLTALAEWATTKLTELATWLQGIFDKVRAFVVPIIQFLEKVSAVVNNIMDLPSLILGGLWKRVPACIRVPVENFLVNVILKNIPFFEDIVAIVDVWKKLKAGAMDIIKTVFITGDLKGGILKAFKLFLDVLNIPVQLVTGIYNKAKAAFNEIVSKPKVIFGNIVASIKAGFQKFAKNFLKNSLDAVGNWIFSKVKGVKMPKEYTKKSVFGLVLDILGITEDNIFDRIEKKKNKKFAQTLRTIYNTLKGAAAWIIDIIKDPKAAYEKAKEKLGELKDKVFTSIGNWISQKIIGVFVAEMTAMLATTPFGEAVEAIIATYNMVKTAIEYAEKVLRMIDSVLDSILELAAGTIAKAVDAVEKGLVFGLEVSIAFIARMLSIGNLPEQVKKIVEEDIRPTVNIAIDAVVGAMISVLETLKEFASDAKDALLNAFDWGKTKVPFTAANGEPHHVYMEKKGAKPVLMVASTPQSLENLIKEYKSKYRANADKMKIVADVESAMTNVSITAAKIAVAEDKLKDSKLPPAEAEKIKTKMNNDLQTLVYDETVLTLVLAKMMKGENYKDYESIYDIEGQVGVHGASPKSTQFNADHQPNNSMLQKAALLPQAPALLKEVVKERSSLGYTIVIGVYRHYEGRTYGGKATTETNNFLDTARDIFDKNMKPLEKVRRLESALKWEAEKDANMMIGVVDKKDINLDQWRDIKKMDLNDQDKEKLRQKVETQVKNGESIIKKTNIVLNVPIQT